MLITSFSGLKRAKKWGLSHNHHIPNYQGIYISVYMPAQKHAPKYQNKSKREQKIVLHCVASILYEL